MTYPLEDYFEDILSKAQRGLGLSDREIAARADIDESTWQDMTSGNLHEDAARKVAPVLGLDDDSLIASGRKEWVPEVQKPQDLQVFTTSYGDMEVNAYLVKDPDTNECAIFDSGADASPIIDYLKEHDLKVRFILITHSHGDHVADLNRLKDATGAPAYTPSNEPVSGAETFEPGKLFEFGEIEITTRLTWGHSRGGVSYIVSGTGQLLAIVGDALFAGSMGGPQIDYQACLNTNREELFTLPEETIVCPGHGCLTTIGQEKHHNPFFAAWFQRDPNVWH